MATLEYSGRVIVGTCENCGMAVWGKPGTTSTAHGHCGVVVVDPARMRPVPQVAAEPLVVEQPTPRGDDKRAKRAAARARRKAARLSGATRCPSCGGLVAHMRGCPEEA